MKPIQTIGTGQRPPEWAAATAALRRGESAIQVMRALLGVDQALEGDELDAAVMAALAVQRSPSLSIYDRAYVAHIYPAPGVSDGQVFDALRDYAAMYATPDPAMVEARRNEIVALLGTWATKAPPSVDDAEFWRRFDAAVAKTGLRNVATTDSDG